MEETNFDFNLNFDVELLFPSTSNNDHGLFDFDSFDAGDWNAASEFVDDLFSVPNPGSQSDMTIPRFTELAADDPLETLDASSTESAIDPTPVVVAPVAENAKRTRTRRKAASVVKGCNMYGRAGKQRCFQCRKWRQKCVYKTLDDPCTLCQERGFKCGRKEKVFGPKTQIQTSDGDLDRSSLQHMFPIPHFPANNLNDELNTIELSCFSMLGIMEEEGWKCILIPFTMPPSLPYSCSGIIFEWPDFHLSSKAFRYAALALSSSIMETRKIYGPKIVAVDYLTKFYKYMRDAIEAKSIAEILFASCIMVMESWLKDDLPTLVTHFTGLSAAYSLVRDGGLSTTVMQTCFDMLFDTYFRQSPLDSTQVKVCRDIDTIIRTFLTIPAISGDPRVRPFLTRYLYFYMDHYLLERRTVMPSIEPFSAVSRLVEILPEIFRSYTTTPYVTTLIMAALDASLPWPWLSNTIMMHDICEKLPMPSNLGTMRDTQREALNYGLALVVGEIVGTNHSPALCIPKFNVPSGLILCRLCALVSAYYTATRALTYERFGLLPHLLWAGFALVNGLDPSASAWISRMLRYRTFWSEYDNPVLLPRDQWVLESLSQNLYMASVEGQQRGVAWFDLKKVDVFECNRIALKGICFRERWFAI